MERYPAYDAASLCKERKADYTQMTLSEGIDILQNLIEYVIKNETKCGGNVDVLVVKKDEADWHVNQNEYQTVILE